MSHACLDMIHNLEEISRDDVTIAGGKGANIGELMHAGLLVPPGFVLLTPAYHLFIESNKIQGEIERLTSQIKLADPGWTPVFPLVSGIVLEIGGQLSHGAIVAREYAVPAVVNVQGAMRCIQDGQMITVDGTHGRVYVDEGASSEQYSLP